MSRRERRAALVALPADDFEWLVHALVEAESHSLGLHTRKMRAPDGGADTLVLRGDGTVSVAVQIKHYPVKIHWAKCEESLATALRVWNPDEVRFVFSCDFTVSQQLAFTTRLVGAAPSKLLRAWTLSDIEQRLDAHPAVARQFLGPDATSVTAAIDRAARFGGLKLDSADDLLERARELAEHGGELDPHYDYATYSGPLNAPSPVWPSTAATLISDEGGVRVEIAAFPRPGHDPGTPTIQFADDEAGSAALETARAALGAGLPVSLPQGVRLSRSLEPRLAGLVDKDVKWAAQLSPSRPTSMLVQVVAGAEGFEREFMLHQVPPRDGQLHAFMGSSGGLRLEFSLLSEILTTGEIQVELWTEYGHDAARNLQVSELLRLWVSRTRVRFSGALAGDGIEQVFDDGPFFSEPEFAELESRMDLFRRTTELETYFGRRLNFPLVPTVSDAKQLLWASHLLETRSGSMTYDPEPVVISGSALSQLIEETERPWSESTRVTVEIFGDQLDFGEATYVRPKLRITNIKPLGPDASSPTEVTLEVDGDARVTWHLVGPPPRIVGAP